MTVSQRFRSRAAQVELTLIAVATGGVALAGANRAFEVSVGRLAAGVAILLFAQSLLRDLARLVLEPRVKIDEQHRLVCLCAESTISIVVAVAAVILMLAGVEISVRLTGDILAAVFLAVSLTGFFAKDFVVGVSRAGIYFRRETHHGRVRVW
ncbi:MAG: hypothetical protein H6684_11560 [Deltaproteobacteria bacterium]|nr:hypothetical protein [Deltaproteobacteria bacterium]